MFVIQGASAGTSSSWKYISSEKVYSLIREGSGLWLVDVRGSLSFDQEHVEGAVNIPASSLETRELPRNRVIVLVDDSLGGKMAKEAAGKIAEKGHQKVFILDKGIAGWKIEGYPTVGGMGMVPLSKAVSKEELKWAIDSGIPMKIYDMRDPEAVNKGSVPGSSAVEGSNTMARIENLKKQFKKPTTRKGGSDLAKRLEGPQTIVLVFSANDDSQALADKAAFGAYGDVRYLQGGYEGWAVNIEDRKKISEGCPACPKTQK